MREDGNLECGCVPGEVCCQKATDASRKMRDIFPRALMDGDWSEFDELRAWLLVHHFPERSEGRRTGTFRAV